jgi:Periplasmic component of the Tol biopolymer transport system
VPIAVVDFQGDAVGGQMASVIRNDLQSSGLFRSIPPGSFIQKNLDASAPPRFPDWRQIGAAGVVVGSVTQVGGNIKVDFRLWDVIQGSQAAGLSFTSQPNNWRRLSHIIADAIYKRVTGEEGYFDTRIAYVSESGPLNARVKRIAIMDQDGPTTATSPTAARSPSRRASRRPCRRSSTWPMARTVRRPRSTCRVSTAAAAS